MSKKKFFRKKHCKGRSWERYRYKISDRVLKRIKQKIFVGKYEEASFESVPKSDRCENCLYCIVRYANIDFLCVYDKFENDIKTFLKPPSGHFQTMHKYFSKLKMANKKTT